MDVNISPSNFEPQRESLQSIVSKAFGEALPDVISRPLWKQHFASGRHVGEGLNQTSKSFSGPSRVSMDLVREEELSSHLQMHC